ncbi:MAG: hypothetical protein JO202_07115 [Ktedonobacteraceae bacterium]|nr:hypothetical protein [Ktedonobacteraceae bacterium]
MCREVVEPIAFAMHEGSRGIEDEFFEEALEPENWAEEHVLQTDGTLYLRSAARREGFSPEATQALARFLSEHITLPNLTPTSATLPLAGLIWAVRMLKFSILECL